MQPSTRDRPLAVLLGANVLPLAGVLALGWDPVLVLLLYWLEIGIVLIFNVPKLLLAEATRDGRLPDDVALWDSEPTFRLNLLWLAVYGLVIAGVLHILVAVVTPLEETLAQLLRSDAPQQVAGTVLLAVVGTVFGHAMALRRFITDREYRRVTPTYQVFRPAVYLWLLAGIVILADGGLVPDDQFTAVVAVVILTKSGFDILTERAVDITPPTLPDRFRRTPPTGQPAVRVSPAPLPLLAAYTPLALLGVGFAASLGFFTYGLFILELVGIGHRGEVLWGVLYVLSAVCFTAAAVWAIHRRYTKLEYRIYPSGIAVYNTHHDTLVRFLPATDIQSCEATVGPITWLFSTESVRITYRQRRTVGRISIGPFDIEMPELRDEDEDGELTLQYVGNADRICAMM